MRAGHCGDDFFNIKTTMHLLLECESALSCVVINPHVSGEQPIMFGGRSVLATVRAGDHFSFFAWPKSDMVMPGLTTDGVEVERTARLTAPALRLAQAASRLEASLVGIWPVQPQRLLLVLPNFAVLARVCLRCSWRSSLVLTA